MTDQVDEAKRIENTINTPGWRDIERILTEMISERREKLFNTMAKRPNELTGKTAISQAAGAHALSEFLEDVKYRVRINLHTEQRVR